MPKIFTYSSDTIKDIYVKIRVTKTDSIAKGDTYYSFFDTIIHLDTTMLISFIRDINKNILYFGRHSYEFNSTIDNQFPNDTYELIFVSNNGVETCYRIVNDLFIVAANWEIDKYVLRPTCILPDIQAIYKLQKSDILDNYNLVRKKH